MPAKIEMIGKKFGLLTVIAKDENKTTKQNIYWICQCDCGNLKSVRGTSLRAGETKSCGCLQKKAAKKTGKNNVKDLLGQRFGKLVVIKRDGSQNNKATWICQCDCGNKVSVSSTNLVQKRTQSCGCINISLGESNIENCLIENGIKYQKQFSFSDLPNRRFDFAIFDKNNNLLQITEFDGPQHYDPKYNWYSEDQVKRDKEKDKYCHDNNIKLIRIGYEYRDNITLKILGLENYNG